MDGNFSSSELISQSQIGRVEWIGRERERAGGRRVATEANLICYRGRTGVRERSEEVLFIHSLPRKVSSNEERSDGRRQRIARSFGPRKSAPFLPRYSSPQLRLRWCRHAAGRLLELRGTGGRAEAAASNINYDARSLARPPSLPLSLSRFIFIILEFPLLSDRRRHAVPLPSFLHCFPSRDDCGDDVRTRGVVAEPSVGPLPPSSFLSFHSSPDFWRE